MGDFGIKRQRLEFVGDVQENADFEIPRLDRAACVFCVRKCKSVMMDSTELPSSSTRVVDGSQRERFLSALDVEMIDHWLTLEVLCPRAPVDYATSVPKEKVHYSMNLKGVLRESLQHYGIKRSVLFTKRIGSTVNVNIQVTDTQRAILSVHKGCGNGSMIVFTPDGKGKIVNGTKCIDQVKQIMASTPRFDIVYDRGASVLDVDVNDGVYVNDERQKFESDSGISFPLIRKKYWERALKPSTGGS